MNVKDTCAMIATQQLPGLFANLTLRTVVVLAMVVVVVLVGGGGRRRNIFGINARGIGGTVGRLGIVVVFVGIGTGRFTVGVGGFNRVGCDCRRQTVEFGKVQFPNTVQSIATGRGLWEFEKFSHRLPLSFLYHVVDATKGSHHFGYVGGFNDGAFETAAGQLFRFCDVVERGLKHFLSSGACFAR